MLRLRVHRWQHELRIPRSWDAARGAHARSDLEHHTEAIGRALADALAGALADDEVIVLPQLAIDGRFDPRADWNTACTQWARQLARGLLEALHDPHHGALRLPSSDAYAARYALARARGEAVGCWWFSAFDGLAMLPVAQAIGTLLGESMPRGLGLLAALDAAEARSVVRALGERGALRVLARWCEAGAAPDALDERTAERIVDALWQSDSTGGAAEQALCVLAEVSHSQAGTSLPVAASSLALWGAVLRLAWQRGELQPTLLSHFAQGANPALALPWLPGAGRTDGRQVLRALPRPLRRQVVALTALRSRVAATPAGAALHTPFGGVAWLLAALDDFLQAADRLPWPDCRHGPPGGVVRLALACAAQPPSRALALWRDDGWRTLLGLDPHLDFGALHAWLSDGQEAAEAWSAQWPQWLARWSRSTSMLRLRLTRADAATPWPVDRTSGLWLSDEAAAALPASSPLPWATRLSLSRKVRDEARFLAANEFIQRLPPAWQPLLLHAAQAALRRLAARVPGLAWSSAGHLHANLLDVRAQAIASDVPDASVGATRPSSALPGATWRLRIARPPLDVLLAMTSLARVRLALPDGRHLDLQRDTDGPRP